MYSIDADNRYCSACKDILDPEWIVVIAKCKKCGKVYVYRINAAEPVKEMDMIGEMTEE